MQYKFYLTIFLFSIFMNANAQQRHNKIAILDLTDRNEESNQARLISSIQMIDVAGLSNIVTKDLDKAGSCNMIFCTLLINKKIVGIRRHY